MDMIFDVDREEYLHNLYDLQNKVNPKPFSDEERELLIQAKIQERNERSMPEYDPMDSMEREYNNRPGFLEEIEKQDEFLKKQTILSEKVEFVRDIKDIGVGNLKVLANVFNERLDEDPSFEWKRDLTLEVLKERERDFGMDFER